MQFHRKFTWLLFSQLFFVLPAYPHRLDFSPIRYLAYYSLNDPSQSSSSAGILYHFEPTTSRQIFLSNNNIIYLTKPIPRGYGKIAGAVFDSETLNPIEGASVLFSDPAPSSTASPLKHGQFLTTSLSPGETIISITHPRYKPARIKVHIESGKVTPIEAYLERNSLPKTQEIDVSSQKEIELPITPTPSSPPSAIPAAPKKHPQVILRKSFPFASESAKIIPANIPLLNKFVDEIIDKSYIRILVEGHTDNRGNIGFKKTLSTNRAKIVANYLIQRGIDQSKLSTKGLADSRPVVPNLTERGRALNRRVEVLVVKP